jgi:replicative DNA helicase
MGVNFDVNVENEQIVLGALLADDAQRRRFLRRVKTEHFVDREHRALVEALRDLERRGVPYAADTVVQITGERVKFKYLAKLEDKFGALPDENLALHLDLLERAAVKESARHAFDALYAALDDVHSPLATVEEAAAKILHAARGGATGATMLRGPELRRDWEGELLRAVENREDNFRPFFFSGLDDLLYEGMRPGNVTIVAARPGMGKTSFVSNMLLRQSIRGRKSLGLPIEPGRDAAIEQMACARSRVPLERVIKEPDKLGEAELFGLRRAARELLDHGRLDLVEQVGTVDDLEALVAVEPYDLVTIDLWEYLMPDLDPRVVTQALRRLKFLAKKRRFHAVVVHQIKRIRRIKNPRPQLHELKNSGGYEEVADLVLLLHRQKYYNPEVENDVLEIDVAKQRRGPQNVRVGFEFDPTVCRVGKHLPDFDPRDAR